MWHQAVAWFIAMFWLFCWKRGVTGLNRSSVQIFDEAKQLAVNLNPDPSEILMPCKAISVSSKCSRQHRCTDTLQSSILPMLDTIIQDITGRFGDRQRKTIDLFKLLPYQVGRSWWDVIIPIVERYAAFLDPTSVDRGQYESCSCRNGQE